MEKNQTDAINSGNGSSTLGQGVLSVLTSADGAFFLATVSDVFNKPNRIRVSADKSIGILVATYVPNMFSQALGVSFNYLPPIGETVLCMRDPNNSGECYALGVIPTEKNVNYSTDSNFIDVISKKDYEGTSGEYRQNSNKTVPSRNSGVRPADLVDGEAIISHPSGTGVEILSNLAALRASDLAFVEAFIQDDLIRIMSMNYEHIHAAGETKVVINGGMVDQVQNITDTESNGLNSPENNLKFLSEGKNDLQTQKDDKTDYYLDGKWLLTDFKGKLGNVISGWIRYPETLISMDGNSGQFQSGRARYHFNQDGTFVLQSLGDIIIEKVQCIPVPRLNKKKLDELYDISKRELKYYAQWIPVNGTSAQDYQLNLYQIRDYARYLTNYLTLAEFRAQAEGKDPRIVIPTDAQMSNPTTGASSDGINQNTGAYTKIWDNYLVYSTARFMIMRNGDVAITDNSGNSLSMNIDGIKLCSSTNMEIHSAGSINMYAGTEINVLARKDIELSSVLRGVLIKANRWLEAFCWKGPMVLQSNYTKLPDNPDPEERKRLINAYAGEGAADDGDYLRRCGNTKTSAITIRAADDAGIQVIAGGDTSGDRYSDIVIKAKSRILTYAKAFWNKLRESFIVSNWFSVSQKLTVSQTSETHITGPVKALDITLKRGPYPPRGESGSRSLVETDTKMEFDTQDLKDTSSALDSILYNNMSNASFSYRKDGTSGYGRLNENLTIQALRVWNEVDKNAMPKNIKADNFSWKMENLFTNPCFGDSKTIGYPWPRGSQTKFQFWTYTPKFTGSTDVGFELTGKPDTIENAFNWLYYEGIKPQKKEPQQ